MKKLMAILNKILEGIGRFLMTCIMLLLLSIVLIFLAVVAHVERQCVIYGENTHWTEGYLSVLYICPAEKRPGYEPPTYFNWKPDNDEEISL